MDAFPALLVVDGGERLVHRLPEPMIETLAKMTKEEILTSSEKWASSAESRCAAQTLGRLECSYQDWAILFQVF
jgi:hypothetical protein